MKTLLKAFVEDTRGLALSEYLVMLGLISGGIAFAILLANTAMGDAWTSWAGWIVDRFTPS